MATHKSKYSQKFKIGKQMYGPGCCAHKRKVEVDPSNAQRTLKELPHFTDVKTER